MQVSGCISTSAVITAHHARPFPLLILTTKLEVYFSYSRCKPRETKLSGPVCVCVCVL